MMIYEPGDLPVAGTGTEVPDHEELVVPFTYLLNLFHHSFYFGRRFFYVKGEIVPVNMTVFLPVGEILTFGGYICDLVLFPYPKNHFNL